MGGGPRKDLQARPFTPEEIADAERHARRETLRMELGARRKDHRLTRS